MPPGASALTRVTRSFLSSGCLGSSVSAVACTRGGRPGGSRTRKAVMGLEVRVTGTTAKVVMGASSAARGTSGLMSAGNVSEEEVSWKAREEARSCALDGDAEGVSGAGMSKSVSVSATPFTALEIDNGETVRDGEGAFEGGFSAVGIQGAIEECLWSPPE